jgi:hypothetical protein
MNKFVPQTFTVEERFLQKVWVVKLEADRFLHGLHGYKFNEQGVRRVLQAIEDIAAEHFGEEASKCVQATHNPLTGKFGLNVKDEEGLWQRLK